MLRGCDVRNKEMVSCTVNRTLWDYQLRHACMHGKIYMQVFKSSVGKSPLSSCVFVGESQALAGSENGVVATVDLRKPQ